MQAISTMEPAQPLAAQEDRSQNLCSREAASIGLCMGILGLFRVATSSADWLAALLGSPSFHTSSSTAAQTARYFIENPPAVALSMIWLVLLGIAVSKLQRPEPLQVASATFLLLATFGLLQAGEALWLGGDVLIQIGSFRMSRTSLALGDSATYFIGAVGLAQLLAEFFVAVRSASVSKQLSIEALPAKSSTDHSAWEMSNPTRSVFIIGAWAISLTFVILVVRIPKIPKFSELLSASPKLRTMLLNVESKGNPKRIGTKTPDQDAILRQQQIQDLLDQATKLWRSRQYEDSSQIFEKAIEILKASDSLKDPQFRTNLSLVQNNLAWLLVTRPDSGPVDAKRAVECAHEALANTPSDGRFWNTLAAAQYRAKNWQEAKDALLRSMELRGDGDGYDWILFSLIYAQTGRKDRARDWYEKAANWRLDFQPWDYDLYGFELEAAKLLGLPEPSKPRALRQTPRREERDSMIFRGRGLPPQVGEPKRSHRNDG